MTPPPRPSRRPGAAALAALALGLLSLLVAVSATSYAAGLAKGSVGTDQLQRGAVTAVKIRPGAVTGAQVQDRSLRAADLAAGVVPPAPRTVEVVLGPGQDRVLATVGRVRVVAECEGDSTLLVQVRPTGTGAGGLLDVDGFSTSRGSPFDDTRPEFAADSTGETYGVTPGSGPTLLSLDLQARAGADPWSSFRLHAQVQAGAEACTVRLTTVAGR